MACIGGGLRSLIASSVMMQQIVQIMKDLPRGPLTGIQITEAKNQNKSSSAEKANVKVETENPNKQQRLQS